jgi:hypothetical protein
MAAMTVRPATRDDAAGVQALVREAGLPTGGLDAA